MDLKTDLLAIELADFAALINELKAASKGIADELEALGKKNAAKAGKKHD